MHRRQKESRSKSSGRYEKEYLCKCKLLLGEVQQHSLNLPLTFAAAVLFVDKISIQNNCDGIVMLFLTNRERRVKEL